MKLLLFCLLVTVLSRTMMGSWQKCNSQPNEVVEFAEKHLLSNEDGLSIEKLSSCESQLVAGMNFRLTFQVTLDGASDNRKITVYKDLSGKMEVTHIEKPIGGFQHIEPTNSNVVGAAEFAISKLNERSNSVSPLVLIEVSKSEVQLVSGINYRMTLKIAFQNDLNNWNEKVVIVYQSIADAQNGAYTSMEM